MTQVIHGLTREQLTGLTFDPTERMLKALIEQHGRYKISKDGVVTPIFERDSRSEKGGKSKTKGE
ncbi:MAG TPA: hypothetical protein DEO73_17425 [Pantoea sp.]|nr:hypothetical protein [Pantoea sp.]